MVPRRAEEGEKRSQTASRTKKRTKTTPRPSWDLPRGRFAPFCLTSRGLFGRPKTTQNGTENDPKSKRKSRVEKKRSKTIKDPSWSDLGPFGGAMWEPEGPKSIGKRAISCKITFSKIRRCEDHSGTPSKRPRSLLGASWGDLGGVLGRPWAVLGRLGTLLARPGALRGRSRALPGATQCHGVHGAVIRL